MTHTTNTQIHQDAGVSTSYNVIAVTFDDDVNAYAAVTKLKEFDSQGQLDLQEAAVVQREAGGSMTVKDRVGTEELVGTASGGLVGLLVGVLGGPLGMLLGGSYGLFVGSLFDLDEGERAETTLAKISESVQAGRTAVLAVVTEPSPEVIDAAMAALGGTVLRRSVYEVEAEVAAVEEAERKAAAEARREMLRSKREQSEEAVHAKVEELKAKLGRRETASTSGAPAEAS